MLFALKLNLNEAPFCREILKFGYFNNQQIIKRVKRFKKLNILVGKLTKNDMLIKNNYQKKVF